MGYNAKKTIGKGVKTAGTGTIIVIIAEAFGLFNGLEPSQYAGVVFVIMSVTDMAVNFLKHGIPPGFMQRLSSRGLREIEDIIEEDNEEKTEES